MANLIDSTVRRPGDFVARYGGEEFAVLLSNTTEDGAAGLAERIRTNVGNAIIDNGEAETSITVSLGVAALITTATMEPDDLIKAADCALYEAKNTGRNKVIKASSL